MSCPKDAASKVDAYCSGSLWRLKAVTAAKHSLTGWPGVTVNACADHVPSTPFEVLQGNSSLPQKQLYEVGTIMIPIFAEEGGTQSQSWNAAEPGGNPRVSSSRVHVFNH